jgi:hypothetical protein
VAEWSNASVSKTDKGATLSEVRILPSPPEIFMQSKAKTVKEYLNSLPADRKQGIEAVRKVILQNLPKGYEETMQYGMISYVVPLKTFPEGYGGKKDVPLPYACLASQKNYFALYLMGPYGNKDFDTWFRKAYKATGKKLDMGKGCVRFKKLENLAVDVIGEAMSKVPVNKFVSQYKNARKRMK